MDCERADLEAFYQRYLQRCNEHRLGELGEFVEALPDYHWDLRHLLVDGCWLSAHLLDTGTTASGRPISMPEFAIYRVADGRIIEVWGDLDRTRLMM